MILHRLLCAVIGHRGVYRKVPVVVPCPRCGEPFKTAPTTAPAFVAYRFLCAGVLLGASVIHQTWRWLRGRES